MEGEGEGERRGGLFGGGARVCQSAFCELLSASFCRSRSCPATAMRRGGPCVRSAWLEAEQAGRGTGGPPKERPGRRVDTAVPQVAKISGLLVPYRVPAVVGWFLVAAASQGKQ